jgi:hypothetical protein
LLLSAPEINAAIAATAMTIFTSAETMWGDSAGVADRNCLAVDGPVEDKMPHPES